MIKSFKTKALSDLWSTGRSAKIDAKLHKRILQRLDRLEQAKTLEYLDVSGFNFHALRGFRPTRYTSHVNGPWCITFEFEDGNVYRIDLEQSH